METKRLAFRIVSALGFSLYGAILLLIVVHQTTRPLCTEVTEPNSNPHSG